MIGGAFTLGTGIRYSDPDGFTEVTGVFPSALSQAQMRGIAAYYGMTLAG
jgi:hypothetical protein